MQKPTVGAPRPEDRPVDRDKAAPNAPINRLAGRATRAVQGMIRSRVAAAGTAVMATLRPFSSAERALPIAVAAIVAVAALLAFLPVSPQGAVGAFRGSDSGVRLAVNGGVNSDSQDSPAVAAATTGLPEPEQEAKLAAPAIPSFQPVTLPQAVTTQPGTNIVPEAATTAPPTSVAGPEAAADPVVAPSPTPESAVQEDGTLLTGYAPDTTVEDGADLILTYKVQSGDTLQSVAKQFGVSPMTLWWANKLKSKSLRPNAVLRIPPVSGLVYTVKDTDTLDAVATKFKVDPNKIVELNGLSDPTLVVGQVLVLPGAKGAPMPTAKPTLRPAPVRSTGVTGGVLSGGPTKYSGGVFKWPVIGGNNYISQYYHYGHWAIDIAADYGSKVVAAASGKVIFAGWKSNGGGYQVWISHGSGIYTTYNHMSAVLVSNGQAVGKGTQVGRIGASGDATGPHLHFEVWNGKVWDGGQRVNPLRYF